MIDQPTFQYNIFERVGGTGKELCSRSTDHPMADRLKGFMLIEVFDPRTIV